MALYPVWLNCKGCGGRLIGDRLIKAQGIVIPIIAVGVGVAIGIRSKWDQVTYILLTVTLIFTCAMVVLTVRRGRYFLNEMSRDAGEKSESNKGERGGAR